MTKITKVVALGATMAFATVCNTTFAQDDLDALLKDLDGTSAKPAAAKTETKAAETAAEAGAATEKTADAVQGPEQRKKVDEVMNLLDNLASETSQEPAKEAEKEAEAVEEKKAEEPATEAKSEPAEAKAETAKAEEKAADEEKPEKVAAPANPDAELIANIRDTEKLRREALDKQAQREITEARNCMDNAEYGDAVRHFGLALKLLNDRQSSKVLRKECDLGIAEGLYRAAMQEDELGRRDRAQKLMEKALDMRHPKARRVLEKWLTEDSASDGKSEIVDIRHRMNDEEYKISREQIRRHLRRSRQYLALLDIKHALEECEVVLVNDPYNRDAIRLRNAIQKKRKVVLQQERVAARDGMIADVDEAWRPVYAVNASQLKDSGSETVKAQTGDDPERTVEQEIVRRMKEMRLPTISFKPPATIIDAVDFFRSASRDYDRPDIPIEKRGFNFVLKTPQGAIKQQSEEDEGGNDFASNNGGDGSAPANGLDPIPTITASDISFYEALKLVCDSVEYKFIVRGQVIMVMHKDMSTAELIPRKYNVPEAFVERVNSASDEVKQLKAAGGFGGNSSRRNDEGEESQERDWKEFFEQMGVKWPEGSSITHIKALGKLYVRNTLENLAEFEKVLEELGATPPLIEIETRFVEVSQEDLNSLGFEWILNSDYSLSVGKSLGRALGIKESTWGSESGSRTINTGSSQSSNGRVDQLIANNQPSTISTSQNISENTASMSDNYQRTIPYRSVGGKLIQSKEGARNIGLNAFGGTSDYQNGNRYLSTAGNHISGESNSNNDQFMRVNAFLGQADLSMILHMLSQRSDTDLLSAPKVVTRSGENAVIKVVTEYIYPQDYDVQLQSSSSSGSSSSGGSQSAILAVVEPQNFTMREVGVILDVTPQYIESSGGIIELELKPSVVDEPVWHNYGMKIPFTGNSSLQSFEGMADIPLRAVEAVAALGGKLTDEAITTYQNAIMDSSMTAMASTSGAGSMTWYDAPMEQPFFHVRSIDSKVSIVPGSTVVMGGLITEMRKAMDDKVPFLGDLPYIGRLFRSHAEQTVKKNLLIFVTGRLITPSGREINVTEDVSTEAEVKAAPKAE